MTPTRLDNYLKIATTASELSPDSETKVGCVLVGKQNEILLTSYNGFISGANDSILPTTRPEKYSYILHAESNAIFQAANRGISIRDCTALVTLSPCINCLRALYQSGIRTVYFKDKYRDFDSQLSMLDLKIQLTPVGIYTRIDLSVG